MMMMPTILNTANSQLTTPGCVQYKQLTTPGYPFDDLELIPA